MQKTLNQQIDRAKELLATAKHAAMATVNADGSPHNSPIFFLYSPDLTEIYWGSHPESMHSQNIVRTGQLFVVVYDAFERGGLFIQATDGHQLAGQELDVALKVHNTARNKDGREPLPRNYYIGDSPQRMWAATVTGLWVNGTQRDANGLISKDIRTKIKASDLTS